MPGGTGSGRRAGPPQRTARRPTRASLTNRKDPGRAAGHPGRRVGPPQPTAWRPTRASLRADRNPRPGPRAGRTGLADAAQRRGEPRPDWRGYGVAVQPTVVRLGCRAGARRARWPAWRDVLGSVLGGDHLGVELHGLVDQGLDDLRLGHGLDDLAADEDLALAVAGGDAQVGFAGLARAVDHTAHDRDAKRDVEAVQRGGDLIGQLVDVHLGAAAGRAGHDLQAAGAQAEGLEDGGADLNLLDRRGGEGDPDRVADALGEQGAEGDGRLDRALEDRAGFGDAKVQRVLAALGEQAVGVDHHDRVVVLDRDLDVAEAVLLEQGALPERGLDQGFRGGLAVLGEQALVQRAGVDPDADRYAGVACGLGDVGDLVVERLDVAGVDADRAAAGVDRGEHVLRLEVDVGDDRDLRLARDGGQRFCVVLGGHGDPDDLAARRGELGDLLERGVDVGGQRRGHRLDGHGGVAADGDGVLALADDELTGLAAGREWCRRQLGQAKINTHTEDRLTT